MALDLKNLFNRAPVVAVVPLRGVVGGGSVRRGLSVGVLAGALERAFKTRHVKAVALVVNSPGGSPVQSALICNRIRALADEHKVPVLAFAEDVAASGGYWLACAGDEIWADDSSIIGSIGVVSAGFGFVDLIKRLGVERRVHTAGEHKTLLDPFKDEKADDVKRLRQIQTDIHDAFRAAVRARRGDRLKGDEAALFSGEFWTGRRALELGLIDGIGDVRTVVRAKFGDKVRLRPVGPKKPLLRLPLLRGAVTADPAAGGWDLGRGLLAAVEERLHWHRFGL
ncbi:MAG: S49 family peptidase [Hyphomicrobiales bacterium]|nr:S49 family peptidase [Hyphomicrobiales bacterium]